MIYAVIDTNVLVSALLSNNESSATVIILEKILKSEVIPLYSDEILQEYKNVLSRKKFGFDEKLVDILLNFIAQNGISTLPQNTNIALPDIDDLPFYEVFCAKKDENVFLITGNIKHFPKENSILTPREFLDLLN